jgi:hypothetical protein
MRIYSDDMAIMALRAHGPPVELSDTKSLLAAFLALPRCLRIALTGFILTGAKVSETLSLRRTRRKAH